MIDTLTLAGRRTQTFINPKKTEGLARSLVILCLLYWSISRTCRLGESKRRKYLARVREAIEQPVTTDQLETLAGNLGYAAWVEPFCRPLLIWIYAEINQQRPRPLGHLPPHARAALRVWHRVIHRNRGLSFEYIMNRFPAVRTPIFVDASTSWGIGGFHGVEYFSVPHAQLKPYMQRCMGWEAYPEVPIARLELLAAAVATQLFTPRYPGHIITLYTDNTNVQGWLSSRRSLHPVVSTLVSAIESIKYHHTLKLSVRYITSGKNRTADYLSRGRTPRWLLSRGAIRTPNMRSVACASDQNNILQMWSNSC